MITVNQIKGLLREHKVKFDSSMRKAQLLGLVHSFNLASQFENLEIASSVEDLPHKKVIQEGRHKFTKVWETKATVPRGAKKAAAAAATEQQAAKKKVYAAVLRSSDDRFMLVKGTVSGNGLGRGGGKWTYDKVIM